MFVIVCATCHNDTAARKTNLQFVGKLKTCSYLRAVFNLPLMRCNRKADPLIATGEGWRSSENSGLQLVFIIRKTFGT